MDSGHWLSGAAARHPERPAVLTGGEAVDYRDLLARAVRGAGCLHALGARRGDPVGIALEPGIAFAEALHGCLLLGTPAVPVDPRLPADERRALLRDAAVVVQAPLDGPAGFALPDPPAGDDVALLVHTSGTTGAPARHAITYANVRANARGVAQALALGDDERWLCPLPLTHVGGLMVLLRSVLMATTAVLVAPSAVAEGLGEDITVASLVPTQLVRGLDAGIPAPPSLRRVLLGGGPMPVALLERAAAAGWPVCPSYGLTQACSAVCVAEPGDLRTAGRPVPGVEVAIAPDGEILVSGPTVNPPGILRTGDLGRLDPQGRLVVTGRRRDIIVTGGENVAPAEVEAALAAHPAVAEVAVIGRPDSEWGEAVTALVVTRDGAPLPAAGALRAHCARRLAAYKVPKAFERVDALPRTASGKVRRASLR